MNGEAKAGEFVSTLSVSDVLRSAGIQLAQWANDIAFTDAPYGETWCLEAADRMVCVSELLHAVYEKLPRRTLFLELRLPDGMVGQVAINPYVFPKAEEAKSGDKASSERKEGSDTTIDDFPF